ncbi:MAG: hypothetical protein HY290_10075 [Planctomycetia bacterium]|nr:hypothetical protein [Planctomycetia bacterium]
MSQDFDQVAQNAERIYQSKLRDVLERTHIDEFVAIEPESGDYFLGRTLSQAIGAARKAHPTRLAHAIRVGHKAALHFGASIR